MPYHQAIGCGGYYNIRQVFYALTHCDIVFFKRGKFISLGLPFCFFIKFTIYAISINLLQIIVLVCKHKFWQVRISCGYLKVSLL